MGREELDDGYEVDVGLFAVHADDLRLAVGDELFGLCFGEECHVEIPWFVRTRMARSQRPRDMRVRSRSRATLDTHKAARSRSGKATDVTAALRWRGRCWMKIVRRSELLQEVATGEVREGEGGCLFDEIQDLVESTERLHMDVQAGAAVRQDAGASAVRVTHDRTLDSGHREFAI
jgi:hypothetical protein